MLVVIKYMNGTVFTVEGVKAVHDGRFREGIGEDFVTVVTRVAEVPYDKYQIQSIEFLREA